MKDYAPSIGFSVLSGGKSGQKSSKIGRSIVCILLITYL